MKRRYLTHLHGRVPLHFCAVRFALSLMIAISMIGVFNKPAQACGLITHHVVSELALNILRRDGYNELYQILNTYPGQLTYGSDFPDWGYAYQGVRGEKILGLKVPFWYMEPGAVSIYSDITHNNPEFVELFQRMMFKAINNSSNDEDKKKALAFMFGVISHKEADDYFHGMNNFLGAAYKDGGWNDGGLDNGWDIDDFYEFDVKYQTSVEKNVDVFIRDVYEQREEKKWYNLIPETNNVCRNWDLPAIPKKVARIIYNDWYKNSFITEAVLLDAFNYAGSICKYERDLMGVTYKSDTDTNYDPMRWIELNFINYAAPNLVSPSIEDQHGGLKDLVHHVALKWELTWDINYNSWKPSATYNRTPVTNGSLDHWPVTITLQPETGRYNEQELLSLKRIFTYYKVDDNEFQPYTGPFRISTEGVHQISYYTAYSNYDDGKYPLKEDIKTESLSIDLPNLEDRLFSWELERDHTPVEQSEQFYLVKRGDTLSSISMAFNISLDKLLAANPQIDLPDIIFPGELIRISDFPRSETIPPFYHTPKEISGFYKE